MQVPDFQEQKSDGGWIGIFNRTEETKTISLEHAQLGLEAEGAYQLHNIWNNSKVSKFDFTINPNGVVFLKKSINN